MVKKINERNLEMITTACKYLNYSRHGNLLLGNRALKPLTCVMLLSGPFSYCLILTVPLTVKYK